MELIRQQQQSGLAVAAFCREHGFSDQTFYNCRKRLAGSERVRFALVAADATAAAEQLPIELLLVSGDRMRIAPGKRCRDPANHAERPAGTRIMHLRASVRLYFYASACDMRKGFDGLRALVTHQWNWTRLQDICLSSAAAGGIGSKYVAVIATEGAKKRCTVCKQDLREFGEGPASRMSSSRRS